MQINSYGATNGASAFFSNMDMSGYGDSAFMEAMQEALDAVMDEDNVSVSSAEVDSPYTRHTTDGVTYTLDEVCFTKSELEELREELLKAGAPEEALDKFNVLASQPDGATLAQVLASLLGTQGNVNISQDDAHAITALLGQIDASGTLATDALAMMRAGNSAGALEIIQNALGKMGSTDMIDVDLASLLALGRGLGLDKGALNTLGSPLAHGDLSLTASQFDTLLNPAKSKVMSDAAQSHKLDGALEKTLKPIITKARNRMEKEKAATQLADRRIDQSKILIDKTVQERARDVMDGLLSGDGSPELAKAESEAIDRKLGGRKSAMIGHAGASGSEMSAPIHRESVNNSHHALNAEGNGDPLHPTIKDNSSQLNQEKGGKEKNSWKDFLGRMETRAPMPAPTPTAASFVYSLQNAVAMPEAARPNMNFGSSAPLPSQVASQVTQGMLTAMGNGATRMDLQLNPLDLGNIAITLITRNGEVTAQIRSEKSETMDMINRQADTIRMTLEQQGIKVDKIEVQLENRHDTADNLFQDLGQHNASQEEYARRQEAIRLRNLASLRNNGENSHNSVLAHSMQEMEQSARYAGNALHVVA